MSKVLQFFPEKDKKEKLTKEKEKVLFFFGIKTPKIR
jgi:hypothetical protein